MIARVHPKWTNPAVWARIRRWIETGYTPPVRTSALSRFRSNAYSNMTNRE